MPSGGGIHRSYFFRGSLDLQSLYPLLVTTCGFELTLHPDPCQTVELSTRTTTKKDRMEKTRKEIHCLVHSR